MSSTSSPSVARPRVRVAPGVRRNDAEIVVDLAAAYGTRLDDWQVDVLKAGLGVRPDGSWAASTCCCSTPRQNGKSVVLTVGALAGALLFGEKVIICSAHEQKTSRILFLNLVSYFESFNDLGKRVRSVGHALGREEIRLRDGTHIFFPARTRNTLRGWSVDAYLADEAQLLTDQQWESAKPTLSARSNTQVWLFGTAPQMVGDGEVFARMRSAAHAGSDKKLAWVEYGAAPGADLDDRGQWAAANPGRVEPAAMEDERRELSDAGFARERLNLWPADHLDQVIDLQAWAGLVAPGPPDGTPPSALAVDAGPDRAMAVAGCWLLDDDRLHVEVIGSDYVSDPLNALQWLVDRAGRRVPVVVDGAAAAASLIPALSMQGESGCDWGAGHGARVRRVRRRCAGRPLVASRSAAAGCRGGGLPSPSDR